MQAIIDRISEEYRSGWFSDAGGRTVQRKEPSRDGPFPIQFFSITTAFALAATQSK